MAGGLIGNGVPSGLGMIDDTQLGALADMIVAELRKQFGNAEVVDEGGSKYAVVKLDNNYLRRAILSGVDRKIASVSDVVIRNNVVEIRIRLI